MEEAASLGRSIDLADAALAVRAARVDVTGVHQEWGFPSALAWLRNSMGMRPGRAAERMLLARQLPRLESTAKLLHSDYLSVGYATAICDAVQRLDDADTAKAEDILLGMVQDGCTVQQVGRAGDRITDLIAEREGREVEPDDAKRGYKRSWLTRARSVDGGAFLKGWLRAEDAAAFDSVIGPLARPKATWDDRDLAQRTADALMSVITGGNQGAGVTVIIDLAHYVHTTGDTGPVAPNFSPDTDRHERDPDTPDPNDLDRGDDLSRDDLSIDDLSRDGQGRDNDGPEGGDDDPATHYGITPEDIDAGDTHCGDTHCGDTALDDLDLDSPSTRDDGVRDFGRPTGTGPFRTAARLPDGTPISARRARQLALTGGISPLILSARGRPLYLGRTVRFANKAQRAVLLALYDSCCVHGCPIPAHLCEVHHADGGWKKMGTPTDIDRLAMACGWHNRWIEDHPGQSTQTRDQRGRISITIGPPKPTPKPIPKPTPKPGHGAAGVAGEPP